MQKKAEMLSHHVPDAMRPKVMDFPEQMPWEQKFYGNIFSLSWDSQGWQYNWRGPFTSQDRNNSRQRRNSKDFKKCTSYHTCNRDGPELIADTGAQQSCIGKKTFRRRGVRGIWTPKNVFMVRAGIPNPTLGQTLANIGSLRVRLDIVSQDAPGLIGMDILDSWSKETGKKQIWIKYLWQTTDNRWTLNATDRDKHNPQHIWHWKTDILAQIQQSRTRNKITFLYFRTNYTASVQKEEEQVNSSSNNQAET